MGKKHVNPFVKSSFLYVFASGLGQIMVLLGVFLFTRLMSEKDYGRYVTYYSFVSVFAVLIGTNLFESLNNAYIDIKDDIIAFRKSVLVLSSIIALSVTAVTLMISVFILHRFSAFEVIMAAIHSYTFFVINYRMYSANMENDYKKKMLLLSLPNILQLAISLITVIVLPDISYEARIIGSVAGLGIIAVLSYIDIIKCPGKPVITKYWKYALKISVPSIFMSISYMIMQQCDNIMVTNYCGEEVTSAYSVVFYLGYAMIAVNAAVMPVRQAWLYRKLDKKDYTGIKTLQKWYLILFAFLATLVIMFGKLVLMFLPSSYRHSEYIPPFILSACMMVLYGMFTEVLLFHKKTGVLSVMVSVSAIINLILNAIFIPKFGAIAAGFTTVFAYFILFILNKIGADLCIKRLYSLLYSAAFIAWALLLAAVFYMTESHEVIRYIIYSAMLLIFAIIALVKRKTIKEMLGSK